MKELICITCPKGCHLKVDEETFAVTGNSCPRGAVYGANELRNPVRVVTSTVVVDGPARRLPVKTDRPIPKSKIFEVMDEIAKVRVRAPVRVGDVLIPNAAGTDGNVVATKSLP
jgi:CxxC motif-containing protein